MWFKYISVHRWEAFNAAFLLTKTYDACENPLEFFVVVVPKIKDNLELSEWCLEREVDQILLVFQEKFSQKLSHISKQQI